MLKNLKVLNQQNLNFYLNMEKATNQNKHQNFSLSQSVSNPFTKIQALFRSSPQTIYKAFETLDLTVMKNQTGLIKQKINSLLQKGSQLSAEKNHVHTYNQIVLEKRQSQSLQIIQNYQQDTEIAISTIAGDQCQDQNNRPHQVSDFKLKESQQNVNFQFCRDNQNDSDFDCVQVHKVLENALTRLNQLMVNKNKLQNQINAIKQLCQGQMRANQTLRDQIGFRQIQNNKQINSLLLELDQIEKQNCSNKVQKSKTSHHAGIELRQRYQTKIMNYSAQKLTNIIYL